MPPDIHLDDCWAKTDPESGRPVLTVRDHCLIVGCVAEQLAKTLPGTARAILPRGAVPFAAAHDIGKLTAGFELKCEAWKEWARKRGMQVNRLQNSCRFHAAVSQTDLAERLGHIARQWSLAAGGHHGKFNPKPPEEHSASRKIFAPLRDELATEIVRHFGPFPDKAPPGGSNAAEYPHIAALCGFVILCDWLGSDEENFPPPSPTHFPPASPPHLGGIRKKTLQALCRRHLIQPGIRENPDFSALFTPPGQPAYSPNPLQRACAEHIDGPGLYLVEAPMGMGKTEASLHAAACLISAEKASGLYFALPTQLTSNKIHERVASFLARAIDPEGAAETTLALAHSASWLANPETFRIRSASGTGDDAIDPRAARSWFTSRRALLARYGVGTIDQALMGALPVKFAALRLFGLAGKIVILDEVHTYDAYTGALMDRLIGDLLALRCTVVVLSATLTSVRRASLAALANPDGASDKTTDNPPADDYPLLTCCRPGRTPEVFPIFYPADLPRHKVGIRRISLPEPDLPEEVADEILARARNGVCVLVIRNTVALAQQTFARLAQEGVETGLIHSRFPFHVRNGHPVEKFRSPEFPEGREAHWAGRLGKADPRPKGCVLVATQVAEQSLDIDADLLVTDLCPADMLLQRMGRLWRHMNLRPAASRPCPAPETWLLVPDVPPPDVDADALDNALKPHSAIYAPYVLLRTLEALGEHVELPAGIRPLLEAAYAPRSAPEDPPAWKELRARMDEKIRKLEDRAGFLGDRYLPPQNDDEQAAATRYNDVPTLDLVLLREAPQPQPGGTVRLAFHSGEVLEWSPGQPWSFEIARAVFLSTVRVARHQIPKSLQTQLVPAWLSIHSRSQALTAAINNDGTLVSADDETTPLPFRYEQLRGLIFEKILLEKSTESGLNVFEIFTDDRLF